MGAACSLTKFVHYDYYAFHPPVPPNYRDKSPFPCRYILTRSGIRIPLYVFEPRNGGSPSCVVIQSHGNAADLGSCYPGLKFLYSELPHDMMLVAYDYVGYGLAEGDDTSCTEENTYESLSAVIRFLMKYYHVGPERIILRGVSLGSGVTLEIATKSEVPFLGVYLQSPFLSIATLAEERIQCGGILSSLTGDIFSNFTKIPDITCPVMIMHGNDDGTVPITHGTRLYELVPPEFRYRLVTVPNATHNNVVSVFGVKKFATLIREFIDECISSRIRTTVAATESSPALQTRVRRPQFDAARMNRRFPLPRSNAEEEAEEDEFEAATSPNSGRVSEVGSARVSPILSRTAAIRPSSSLARRAAEARRVGVVDAPGYYPTTNSHDGGVGVIPHLSDTVPGLQPFRGTQSAESSSSRRIYELD